MQISYIYDILLVPPRELIIEQKYESEEGQLYTLTCVADHVKPIPRLWWELKSMCFLLTRFSISMFLF